jgi:hypothetical protein
MGRIAAQSVPNLLQIAVRLRGGRLTNRPDHCRACQQALASAGTICDLRTNFNAAELSSVAGVFRSSIRSLDLRPSHPQ